MTQQTADPARYQTQLKALLDQLHRVIVGQDYLLERLLVGLLSDGHILLEGVPGLAKTKTLSALTCCISAQMKRVQFTPDLLPSDLIGTEVYRPQQADFIVRHGPIFTNLLLADEINRAPAKVQSALLQAMQEKQVTIGEKTFDLPEPFLVLATQNPIEQEGTYPLPEAQMDRFIMKIKVTYPSFDQELQILQSTAREVEAPETLSKVLELDQLKELRHAAQQIYLDPKIERYIVAIVQASRAAENFNLKGMIDWGASPRASISLARASKSLALIQGKSFVTPDQVKALAHDVLRHRILVSFEAEARGFDSDHVVTELLKQIAVP